MKATPKAVAELDGWGLSMESGLAELSGDRSGRRLPMEKILFNDQTVVAGDDADWGRDAVKEKQIVAVSLCYVDLCCYSNNILLKVPLRQWIVVVTKRDRSKAVEFLNMMKRVAPPMGIEVWEWGYGIMRMCLLF